MSVGEQQRGGGVGEQGQVGTLEKREQVVALLAAGGDGGPDALRPVSSALAASSLRHAAVDYDVANRLLRRVVGRLQAWLAGESQVLVGMVPESPRQRPGRFRVWRLLTGHAFQLLPLGDQRGAKRRFVVEFGCRMPH